MKRTVSMLLCVLILAAIAVIPVNAVDIVTLTYDLMYDGNTYKQAVNKGTVPEEHYFEREGYECYYVYKDPEFTQLFDFSKPLNRNTTVYVRWLTEDEIAYLNLYLSPDDEYPTVSPTCIKGEAYVQPADPARPGEYFAGWYLNKALTIPYNPTAPIYSDTDLYACFVSNQNEVSGYNIFDDPDAEVPVVGGYIKKGVEMFIPSDPPMDDDEMLMGWYYDRELTNEVDFMQPVTQDYIYLFPKVLGEDDVYWISIYLSTDAEFSIGGGAVEKGQPIPRPEDPGKDDYEFEGWYTDRALTQAADFTSPWYEDVDLFPKWVKAHNHNLSLINEIPATATTDGLEQHFVCTVCGKWFEPVYSALIEIENHESIVIPATGPFIMGDANGDGDVDIRDVTAIQRFLAKFDQTHFCRNAANVISTDGLNINDATRIQQYLAEYIDSL